MRLSSKDIARAIFKLALRYPEKTKEIAKQTYLYLLKRKKIRLLPLILKQLSEIEKEERSVKEVEVITAHPIKNQLKKQIEETLSKKIRFKERIDPEILGGIIIKYDNFVIDGSIKRYLESLKESL